MNESRDITAPIVDLMLGLWRRADRDFSTKVARKAFRDTCAAVLKGAVTQISEPAEDTPTDSPEWARFVAAEDCRSVKSAIDNIAAMARASRLIGGVMSGLPVDDCESDADLEMLSQFTPYKLVRRRRKSNPMTDRRYKKNKTEEELERQKRTLDEARVKSVAKMDDIRGYSLRDFEMEEETEPAQGHTEQESASEVDDEVSTVEYLERRKKNSKPKMVPLPPLPRDYRCENEWVKTNIKSPDMLYSYVAKKTGGGVTWSGGLRKFFDSNDFWEFAFDTLSSGGWCDSESNKPISNIGKYITKSTIGEYVRHERSKYSIFDGKFKTHKDLLDYIEMHCSTMDAKYRSEEYASWFLQQMTDVGWRFNNGSTINNLPKAMSENFAKFQEWCKKNGGALEGLNASQYGETLKIHKAIEKGQWKPNANGKFSALDLKKFL